ncbi:MAG TPA: hypothetical protein VEB67_00680, partial [Nitrososphaerales archaeon]|nr:hypothetical protein [Nitrososphaerales archaeon]
ALNIHRSTVLQWRRGTDRPYFVRCMETATRTTLKEGWRLLPMKLDSGGNVPSDWMMVPERLVGESDVREVLEGIVPLPSNEALAVRFGVRDASSAEGKFEAFAYVLGIMLGDAAKYGGVQNRFTSMNLDLQLSKNRPSNLDLGDYAAMCVQTLGIHMHRNSDKMPTGATARAMFPAPAYRWNSSRSPLIAWMFNVCLGLGTEELTSINPVNMEWILRMPKTFIKRFVQGVADSDGTARPYVVEIASMPNAEFVTKLLSTLGMKTARTVYEKGAPMRTSVLNAEAASLPIFNEFAKSYRYRYLMGRASGMLDRTERSGRTSTT